MKNNNADIINTSYYSIGFPNEDFKKLLFRDNYLSQMKQLLNTSDILFIEGEEDSGKTILCAQFIIKNIEHSLSVFFNTNNSFDYDIDYYLLNIVDQINFILNNEVIEKNNYRTIEEYRSKIFQLRKIYRTNNKKLYLLIDGLENKLKEEKIFINELFKDIIPFGEDIFKIIITGNKDEFVNIFPIIKKQKLSSLNLTGFSTDEIKNFLDKTNLSHNEIEFIFNVTKGYPGRLQTLKRLLKENKYSLDNLDKSTEYNYWIELDCDSVDLEDKDINLVISILLFSDRAFSLDELSKIISKNKNETLKIIEKTKVIHLDSNKLSFISNAHKTYLANILRGNKNEIENLLLNYYANADTINEIFELSKLYFKKREWSSLLKLLDENYLKNLLESTESIQRITESLNYGIKASEEAKKYPTILKYSLQGSIINELNDFIFWESEINARISINDFNGAITLAESAVLKSDRLRLLALIARKQKEITKNVDEDLIKLIKDLYQITDLNSVGNTVYDIVADLIYAIPNLALEIIEKTSDETTENNNINDWIIAKLSMAAIDSGLNDDDQNKEKKLEIVRKINNPSVKKINKAISLLVGNYSTNKVLEEIKKLSDSEEKLKLLRLWLNNNKRQIVGIENVIETAIDELIKSTTKSTFTIDILKELSYQLPYIKNDSVKQKLLDRIKNLESDLKNTALTKNKYLYKLNLFHTEYTLKPAKSIYTLNSILLEIDNDNDLLTKLESYAEVFSKLKVLSRKNTQYEFYQDNIINKRKFVYSRILNTTKDLFVKTADHYRVIENVLKTISKVNPILGLKISNEINTLNRRDRARILILDSYLDNSIKYIKIDFLKEIENSFEDNRFQNYIYLSILDRFSEAKYLKDITIKELIYYNEKINSIDNIYDKLEGKVLFYIILSKNNLWKYRLEKKVKSEIINVWNKIDSEWDKIDNGFKISALISKINKTFAKELFNKTEDIKKNSWLTSKPIAYTFLNSIKLVIKAFSGLLITNDEFVSEGYNIIENLINRVSSKIDKIRLWTELGFYCTIHINERLRRKILDNHIIPIFDELIQEKYNIIDVLDTFTLIHIHNSEICNNYVNSIPEYYKEEIYLNISNFYISKHNPFEIYDGKPIKYNTSYNDIINAISVLEKIDTDRLIYSQIDMLCDVVNNNSETIQKAQKTEIIRKLYQIIQDKLPDNRNIQHNGFKVISEIRLAKLKKDNIDWVALLTESNNIPNISDKIFVKAILLENFPYNKKNNILSKEDLYNEIVDLLNSLDIHYEFVQRVIDISEIMFSTNKTSWKTIVEKAFFISNNFESGAEIYFSRKNIIDSMYRLDPNYAKHLINLTDKEEEKKIINKHIKEYYKSLEIANKIKNNEDIEDKEKENYKIIVRGIYKALASLNSNRITPKKIHELIRFFNFGIKLPLQEVFPMYLYYLSNCSKTYSSKKLTGTVKNIHKINFKEIVNASNIIDLLSRKKKKTEYIFKDFFNKSLTNKTIHPNSKEEAITYIREWLEDNLNSFVIIADSYFRKEDLEILKLIKPINNSIDIDILASEDGFKNDIENEYNNYWKKISDEKPPFTNITFCWVGENRHAKPIHDRWIITKNSGLRLGTSFSGLGVSRESEISIMTPSEVKNVYDNILIEYLHRKKKEINNQRVSYRSFSL